MKSALFTLSAGLVLAGAAIPQDLPPGVLLFSRIQRHIREELQHLPDISCLETVRREHRPPNGELRSLDTVRLEVLSTGAKSSSPRRASGSFRTGLRSVLPAAAPSVMALRAVPEERPSEQ